MSNDLEIDGCEVSLWEAEAALGVVPRGFFVAVCAHDPFCDERFLLSAALALLPADLLPGRIRGSPFLAVLL